MWDGVHWHNYDLLFMNLVPMVLEKEGNGIPYVHGMPYFGNRDDAGKDGG